MTLKAIAALLPSERTLERSALKLSLAGNGQHHSFTTETAGIDRHGPTRAVTRNAEIIAFCG
jgi:hypothetical protein